MKYTIDSSHSSASFSVKHMMIAKVHGGFEKMSGTLEFDPARPGQAKVAVTIDANTVNTREPQRDQHLRSADFFDVEKFPTITFTSTEVKGLNGDFEVTGDLTIHGVTKSVVLKVEGPTQEMKDPYGNLKMGASASTKIKRKDFGLTWNAALETGGILVGDDVTIDLDVQFTRSA
ncbi:MAG TPA: YceI family protein [Bdellovibrionales bacterium]|nr:YceI family protein [Bdellovibrionales bacterium]